MSTDGWRVGDRVLGVYEIEAVLGEGGMGVVHRVRHTGWGTDLAVKSPRPRLFPTAADQETFVREAQTWVQLGLHPNVCGCHYVRVVAGVPRVFAEYVDGGSLRHRIDDLQLYEDTAAETSARILDIAIQVAWGLAHAHRRGVVHQDVKPGNVLLGLDGTAKITDFGLARARQLGTAGVPVAGPRARLLTCNGMTPAYASPEQVRGGGLDERTDVFSFAASVLEMFTGGVTWGLGPAAGSALRAHRSGPPPAAPPVLIPGVVADLLERCLQVDPADRPGDIAAVAAELAAGYAREAGRPYPRRDPGAAQFRAGEFSNRALSLLDLGRPADAQAQLGRAHEADPQHPETTYNRGLLRWRAGELTDDELVAQLTAVRAGAVASGDHDARWRTGQLLAQVHLERGDPAAALALLGEVEQGAAGDPGVGEALRAARSPVWDTAAGLLLHELTGHAAAFSLIDLAADGRRGLSRDEDGALLLWDLAVGRLSRRLPVSRLPVSRLPVSRPRAGPPARAADVGAAVNALRISQDGCSALTGHADGLVLVWDLDAARVREVLTGHTAAVRACALSDDGGRAVSAAADGTLRWWDIPTGRCLRVLELARRDDGHQTTVKAVSLSSDGETAVVDGADVTLWHLPTGRRLRRLDWRYSPLALAGTGQHALKCTLGAVGWGLSYLDLSADEPLWTVLADGRPPTTAVITRDGSHALSGAVGGTLRWWDLAAGRCLRTDQADVAMVTSVVVSADGRIAVTVGADRTVRVWRLPVAGTYTAPLQICRPLDHQDLVRRTNRAARLVHDAADCLQRQRYPDALALLAEVRALAGHERDAHVLDAWHRLSLRCTRSGIRGAWLDRTIELPTTGIQAEATMDGRRAVCADLGGLRLWDLNTGSCLRTLAETPPLDGPTVDCVALDPAERCVLAGGGDGVVRLWDLGSGRCLRVLAGAAGSVRSVRVSPDGRLAYAGDRSGAVTCWDLGTGELRFQYAAHHRDTTGLCLSADGRFLLSSGADLDVQLRRTLGDPGRRVRLFPEINFNAGKQVLTADIVADARLTADGRRAVTANNDGRLRVWDVASGRLLHTVDEHAGVDGHAQTMTAVSLTADGMFALAGSADSHARLVDLDAGRWVSTLTGHTAVVLSVHIAADGRYAVSTGQDNTLRRWELDWRLTAHEAADWDEGARPHLAAFLSRAHDPAGAAGAVAEGAGTGPAPEGLLRHLARAGYGWLRPSGVQAELARMAAARQDPAVFP